MNLLKSKRKFIVLGVLLLLILGLGLFVNVSNDQVNAQEETKDNTNNTNFEEVSKDEKVSKDKETNVNEKEQEEVDNEDEEIQDSEEATSYQEPVQENTTYKEIDTNDNNQTSNSDTNASISTNNNPNTDSNQNNNTSSGNNGSIEVSKPSKPTIPIDKVCGYMTSDEAAYYGVEQLGVGGGIASQMSGFDCISDYSWNGTEWEEVYKYDMPGYDFIGDDGNTYLILGNGYIEQE